MPIARDALVSHTALFRVSKLRPDHISNHSTRATWTAIVQLFGLGLYVSPLFSLFRPMFILNGPFGEQFYLRILRTDLQQIFRFGIDNMVSNGQSGISFPIAITTNFGAGIEGISLLHIHRTDISKRIGGLIGGSQRRCESIKWR